MEGLLRYKEGCRWTVGVLESIPQCDFKRWLRSRWGWLVQSCGTMSLVQQVLYKCVVVGIQRWDLYCVVV